MPGAVGGFPVLPLPAQLPEQWEILKSKLPASSPGVSGPAGVQGFVMKEQGILLFAQRHFSVPVAQTGYGEPSLLSVVL